MSEIRKISRREFMKRTGQASGGLVFALTFTTACSKSPVPGPMASTASVAPNVYVNVRGDGIVEIGIGCQGGDADDGIVGCIFSD